jgi:hypothetical protein
MRVFKISSYDIDADYRQTRVIRALSAKSALGIMVGDAIKSEFESGSNVECLVIDIAAKSAKIAFDESGLSEIEFEVMYELT